MLASPTQTPQRTLAWSVLLAVLAAAGSLAAPSGAIAAQTRGPGLDPAAVARLSRDAGADALVRSRPETGVAGLVRAGRDGDLLPQSTARSARGKAAEFLAKHGALFGLARAGEELGFLRETSDALGMRHVAYRQVFQGVEVFGGELRAHLRRDLALASVAGVVVPIAGPLATTPSVAATEAEGVARIAAAKETAGRVRAGDLAAIATRLVIFDTGLLRGVAGIPRLAWEVEVADADLSVREWLFVDALTGRILDRISGIHEAIRRRVAETSLANVVWDDGLGHPEPIPAGWAGGSASQVAAWNDESAGALESYNLFGSLTNGAYLSYDGADATMRTINNDPGIACPNASWNGVSTNYCNGVSGDDTVAHEWGHAYTEYTHGLIYQWQAGALNEAYSDIWGEVVDFLNGRGTDAPIGLRNASGTACSTFGSGSPSSDATYRWLSGEDDFGFGGAIRDMWRPECYGDPGRVGSASYTCTSGDSGGVHTNSGVPNHGFALLVDGGIYNGETITALGLAKAAHVYWRAASVYQVPASNFEDHADSLEQSCADLIGAPLYEPLTTGPGTWGGTTGDPIDASDCAEVADMIAAVELREVPTKCGFEPLLDPDVPPLCSAAPDTILLQDFESGLAGWTVGTRAVVKPSTFDTPDWAIVGDVPSGRSGSAAFVASDPELGDCAGDVEAGVLYLESPPIAIPAGVTGLRLAFDHWVAIEDRWDGGNLKISVNGGPFTLVPSWAFVANPYNDTLRTSGSDDPLAGEAAFTGADEGSLTGSWGQSRVTLGSFAEEGDEIRLRFEMGLDGCNGLVGWYVDDVHLYSCDDVVGVLCDAEPRKDCFSASPLGASLTVKEGAKDKLTWKISKGDATEVADFLQPTVATRMLSFCIYDGSAEAQPIAVANASGGGICDGKPCWSLLGDDGFKRKSKTGAPNGLTQMKLKAGAAGRTQVQVSAKGALFTAPNPPLTPPVTALLVIDDGTGVQSCWQTELDAVLANQPGTFRAKGPLP
ncbi:MAG: M4 family metallopeptidase [Deltaproteobacteria bacterium]|nr:M4 family metallopeptidase [Deltaproteobacteria bacterium]